MGAIGLAIIGAIIGLDWMFINQHRAPHRTPPETGLYRAIVILTFEWPENPAFTKVVDTSIRSSDVDLNTFYQVMRSQRMAKLVLSSYTPDDLAKMFTPEYNKTGLVSFGKINVEANTRPHASISITVLHPRRDAAEMIVNRYGAVFIQYLNEYSDQPPVILITQSETRVEKVYPWILSRLMK